VAEETVRVTREVRFEVAHGAALAAAPGRTLALTADGLAVAERPAEPGRARR
jgi:hypothetical protein